MIRNQMLQTRSGFGKEHFHILPDQTNLMRQALAQVIEHVVGNVDLEGLRRGC
jgi:hydroxymethylglutaryl-CoA reductase